MDYYQKYLKYKKMYFNLKGGSSFDQPTKKRLETRLDTRQIPENFPKQKV